MRCGDGGQGGGGRLLHIFWAQLALRVHAKRAHSPGNLHQASGGVGAAVSVSGAGIAGEGTSRQARCAVARWHQALVARYRAGRGCGDGAVGTVAGLALQAVPALVVLWIGGWRRLISACALGLGVHVHGPQGTSQLTHTAVHFGGHPRGRAQSMRLPVAHHASAADGGIPAGRAPAKARRHQAVVRAGRARLANVGLHVGRARQAGDPASAVCGGAVAVPVVTARRGRGGGHIGSGGGAVARQHVCGPKRTGRAEWSGGQTTA